MSVTLRNGPRSGVYQSHKPGTVVDEDGGLYVTAEQLKKFGYGDAARGRRDLRSFLANERDIATSTAPTAKPTNVRLGTEADEMAILALLMTDLRENAEMIAPIDEARVLHAIQVGTRFRGGVAGVITDADDIPVAVVILHPIQWWWSQAWYFGEMVLYVHPDHRQSHYSDNLMAFAKWVSEEQTKGFGYRVYLLCGVLGLGRFWAKTAMYRRKFKQVGSAFLHPPPPEGTR